MGGKKSDPEAICSIPRSEYLAEVRAMDVDELRNALIYFTHGVALQRRRKRRIDPFDRDMAEMVEQRLSELDPDLLETTKQHLAELDGD